MQSDPQDRAIAAEWLAAAARPEVAAALGRVYEEVGAAITARGPACWASGRCCNFERAGHRLYVTGLEAAFTLARLGELDPPRGGLSLPQLGEARARGGCPFQVANLCGVHAIRPLGCRVYFCDRSAQEWQQELSERALADIRRIHDEHGAPYRYGEWRAMLELVLGARAGT
jgi:Fe-S-cluster containining protein